MRIEPVRERKPSEMNEYTLDANRLSMALRTGNLNTAGLDIRASDGRIAYRLYLAPEDIAELTAAINTK